MGKPLEQKRKARGRVLVVEDNAVNQKVVVRTLERLGFRADVVANGLEGLEALDRVCFDLVLMDCQMPKMDGYEATRAIREMEERIERGELVPKPGSSYAMKRANFDHLPIIAVTANAMPGDRERCLEAGMDGYISKPIQSQGILETIESLMGGESRPPATENNAEICDAVAALARVDGDQELLQEIASLFLDDLEPIVNRIQHAAAAQDSMAVAQSAHALKGSVSNFFASRAHEAASRLEKLGRAGVGDGIEDALSQLMRSLEDLKPFIEKMAGRE